ncbi:BRCT domain-containing protein [Pseudomonas sp. Irchel s3f10]|jgi:NAD-dependent DNA ligase|uniref:BRCT domain-containing protein n=1 Tax=Pseudomonas sp. Irchel s3f10 TaxID=2009137 RepID=UPI000BA2DFFF|nr:BRCT domain-containing protein [Pseudomonas sp. Irchel s3f10]
MSTLKFSYRDAKGDLSQRELIQWSENSVYIQGRSDSDTFPKTYRKDRIIEVLLGAELLLNEAAPPSPRLQHDRKPPALVASEAASQTPDPKMSPGRINQILFTGFAAAQRAELEQKALEYGLKVMSTAGKTLTFLCYGENAGPTKVSKALEAGAFIINSEQFLNLINGRNPLKSSRRSACALKLHQPPNACYMQPASPHSASW